MTDLNHATKNGLSLEDLWNTMGRQSMGIWNALSDVKELGRL